MGRAIAALGLEVGLGDGRFVALAFLQGRAGGAVAADSEEGRQQSDDQPSPRRDATQEGEDNAHFRTH